MDKLQEHFDKLTEFMAGEILPVIIENLGEEEVDNNQRCYDMAWDLMQNVNLNQMVLDKLRNMLEVK